MLGGVVVAAGRSISGLYLQCAVFAMCWVGTKIWPYGTILCQRVEAQRGLWFCPDPVLRVGIVLVLSQPVLGPKTPSVQ